MSDDDIRAEATAAERTRCAGIVQLARDGEIDTDFRSIISIIKGGRTLEQIEADIRADR